MHVKEAQAKQETKNPLHHRTTQRAGEEVPRETVFIHIRASRVQCRAETDRDPGEQLNINKNHGSYI